MKQGFLGSLAILLTGAGLVFAQASPDVSPSPGETAPEAPAPVAAPENAAPAPVPNPAAVDRQPWNPSLKQAVERPYPEPGHGWLSGLCPDLEEFWLSADYLLWAMKGGRLPPLVTTSPASSRAILGQPGTSVLIGNSEVNRGAFSGGRVAGGVWLDDDQIFGLEGT